MNSTYESIQDYVVSFLTVVLAGLVLWGARFIPPPFFDPLGSAAVPKACATILIGLAILIGVRRFIENKAGSTTGPEETGYKKEPWLALGVVSLSMLYTLAMGAGWIGFRWGTIVYIFATGTILAKGSFRIIVISLALGLLFGFGGHYLFTNFFYIDLP